MSMDSVDFSVATPYAVQQNKTFFDIEFHRQWFARNWHLSIYASVVYLLCIANGQKLMKNRKAYDVKNIIFWWNIGLSFFSLCGSIKLFPELLSVLKNKGVYHSICSTSFKKDPTIEFWMWLFTWSKLIEFGDTVFLVLRKQKLICLHWSHHVITLIYCFFAFSDLPAISRWGITINYMIHTIMYCYYALKTIKLYVPQEVAKIITVLQTIQMLIGVATGSGSLYYVIKGDKCEGSVSVCLATALMSLYYFVLFAHFFINRYQKKSSIDQKSK